MMKKTTHIWKYTGLVDSFSTAYDMFCSVLAFDRNRLHNCKTDEIWLDLMWMLLILCELQN